MTANTSIHRRFLMVRINDNYGQPVPNDKANDTALRLAGIPADAALIDGPVRNVERQSIDLVFSHPSFVQVPHGERMPVVEVTGDHS